MKAFFSLLTLAAIMMAITGCSTCYTEGYQPLYGPEGFRASGMVDDPQLGVYTIEDLRFHPIVNDPDLLAPTTRIDPQFPPAPVVEKR